MSETRALIRTENKFCSEFQKPSQGVAFLLEPTMKTAFKSPSKSKQEVIAAIRECAEKLGHSPSYPALKKMKNITHMDFRKNFGTYTRALREAGIEPRGGGHMVGLKHLFKDWAEIVRSLKKNAEPF